MILFDGVQSHVYTTSQTALMTPAEIELGRFVVVRNNSVPGVRVYVLDSSAQAIGHLNRHHSAGYLMFIAGIFQLCLECRFQ